MEAGAAVGSLFGRERELAQILRFLDHAAAGPALVLEGEPGIGKTSLWQAGVALALERGSSVVQARPAEAERNLSYSALGDLLEPILDRLELLSPPRRRALEVALLLVEEEESEAPDSRAVGLATLDLLRLVAEDRPLIVALDDMQWLDAASRATFAYALRRVDREWIALLGARRPGDDDLMLGAGGERLVVGPLSLAALHELIRGRTDTRMTRATLVRLHETSGGNPFFALELARALEGHELRPGDPLPVPATLSALTAARLERLDGTVREVLLHVAALAHPTREVVTSAAGAHAAAALATAVTAGVIEVEGKRLRFTHPLLASVHYGSASAEDRERVHRRLAEVVTGAEERGRHLGAGTSEPDEGVATVLDGAAVAARARGAPGAAAELAEVALQLTPQTDPAAVVRRLRNAADHHFIAGSTASARALLEQAIGRASPGPERARASLQLARLLDSLDLRAERPLLMRALREAGDDAGLRAQIHIALAFFFADGDLRKSRRHAHIAHDLAEGAGDPRLIAETLAFSLDRDFWAGEGIDHARIRRGIALEERLPHLNLVTRPSSAYAFALKWSGDVEQARPLYERLRSRGHSDGDFDVVHILFFSIFHELISENWEAAAGFAEEAWTLAFECERDVDAAASLWGRAIVAAYRGDADAARADAAEAGRIAVAVGFNDRLLSAPALGVLELSLGNLEAVLAAVRPATEEKLSTGLREPGLMLGFPEHVEAAIGTGELDEASELLDYVEQHAKRLDRAWALACCARGRALLAAARRDDAAVDAAFARAYERHRRRPQQLATYEHARTLLLHGSILRRRQQKRDATDALRRAGAIFERLGARIYAEQARSELARVGGRAAAAGDELTETERRIADLVAAGRSNKEVAAALSLSPKTVEWNLSKVYAKLGVRSRTELASRRRWSNTGDIPGCSSFQALLGSIPIVTQGGDMTRWIILLLAIASAAVAVGTATARTSHPKPIVVTFDKHVVDPTNLVFQGTTAGRAKGSLESRMVRGSLTIEGPIWHFTFDWIVTAKARHKSFVARTAGTFDTNSGRVVMDGSVIDGWHERAAVHEQGQLIDPATFTFAGELQIARNRH